MSESCFKRSRLLSAYSTAAIVFTNCVLIFVLLNVLVWAVTGISTSVMKRSSGGKVPFKHKAYDESLAPVYPNMAKDEVSILLRDTRRLAQIYAPYAQHREANYRSPHVNVLEPGFRRSLNQAPWPPDRCDFKVFIFGGSTTFGYGVPDDQTIPSFLQSRLRHEAGIRASCYNFGRAYYSIAQERVLFEQLITEHYVPDLCIFIDGVNEFCRADGMPSYTQPLAKFMADGEVPPLRKVISELPLIKTILHLSSYGTPEGGTLSSKEHPTPGTDRIVKEVIDRYRANTRLTAGICKNLNIPVAFVWQPTPVYNYDETFNIFRHYDYDGTAPYLRIGYQAMSENRKVSDFGENFIWLADIQEHIKKPLYVSGLHYSGEMCQLIADRIYKEIVARGLLKARHPSEP